MSATTKRAKAPAKDDCMKSPPRIADVLADTLSELGVDVVFALPGGTIAPVLDALLEYPSIRVVNTRTESGAMFAAAAYARYGGKPGLVLVTSGPGAINAMTGLASAHRDGLPVILIAGDVAQTNHGKNAVQDGSAQGLDIVAVAKPLCGRVFDVTRPLAAEATLREAFRFALGARRDSVFINLPMDVSTADAPEGSYASAWPTQAPEGPRPDIAALQEAARLLAAAQRPLLLVGSGARDAATHVRLLAEHFSLPVVTTPKAKGVFPETHALSLGVFGHGGHPSAAGYVEGRPDVVLVLGSSLGDAETNGWDANLGGGALIHVDVDATQFGRSYRPALALHATVESVARALVEHSPGLRVQRGLGVSFFTDAATHEASPGLVAPQRAVHELQKLASDDAVFTSDIGEHLMFATHYLRIAKADGFMVMTGLASMGTGIAAANGIKLATPRRPVIAICGDGCFVMSVGDVITAAQERLGVVIAVLNDGRYGMVELGNERVYGRTPPYPLGPVDIAALARGCGVDARVIRQPGDFHGLDLAQLSSAGPLVLDIRIDPGVTMPKSKRFENLRKIVGGTT